MFSTWLTTARKDLIGGRGTSGIRHLVVPAVILIVALVGLPADISSYALGIDSPFMKSAWNSGKITITHDAFSATYDFSDAAHPVKLAN
jgi:hypothetical protein